MYKRRFGSATGGDGMTGATAVPAGGRPVFGFCEFWDDIGGLQYRGKMNLGTENGDKWVDQNGAWNNTAGSGDYCLCEPIIIGGDAYECKARHGNMNKAEITVWWESYGTQ